MPPLPHQTPPPPRPGITGFVYLITNRLNGKRYVGQTTRTVKKRWASHLREISKNSCPALHGAMRKYGHVNFTVEEIARLDAVDTLSPNLNSLEEYFIKHYRTQIPNGYNISGGGGQSRIHPETRLKLSAAGKGFRHSEESKAKMRAARLGWKLSPEIRAKISAAHKGKRASPETKAKMSARLKGKKRSAEAIAKAAAAQRGRKRGPGPPISLRQRQQISAALKGRIITPEWRAKISATLRARSKRNEQGEFPYSSSE